MDGKGRPEKLNDEIRRFITGLQKNRKRKLKGPEVRAELKLFIEQQVKKEAKKDGIKLSLEATETTIKENLPGLSSIQKYLKGLSGRDTLSPLDNPWHLGILDNNSLLAEVSAEAVAAIFKVQAWLERQRDKPGIATSGIEEWMESFTDGEMTTSIWPLSIREAFWVSKLYRVNYHLSEPEILFILLRKHDLKEKQVKQIQKSPEKLYKLASENLIPLLRPLIDNINILWQAAKTYADYARLCKLAKTDFDTTRLDEAVRSGSIGRTKYDLFNEYKIKKDGETDERSHSKEG